MKTRVMFATAGALLVAGIMLLFAALPVPALHADTPTQPFSYEDGSGVHLLADCDRALVYITVDEGDMSNTAVEVTIDGVRQPDLQVDAGGEAQQTYPVTPGQPHTASVVFDAVVGGTPEEQDQTLSVHCAPTGWTDPTAPTTAPPTTAPASTTTTAPAPTTTSTTAPPSTCGVPAST